MFLKETFEKQGGKNLLRQYWKGGALFTAASQFLILGQSRTALEILRLSSELKIKQKLQKEYAQSLNKFNEAYNSELAHESSNKVWICWFQGMDDAPDIVKRCYKSIVENLSDKEIILLTEQNIKEYVQFPEYIQKKYKTGIITKTHMTDLLRLELLIQYGGTWMDATVYCSSSDIPSYFFESDLFFYQCLKPGRDGHCTYISSWLMSARTNNKILMATKELLYEYWKKNNEMADYYLLHDFISIVLDRYEAEWKRIVPRDNATPHELLLRLFEPYNEETWNAIKGQTPFHKLSYKLDNKRLTDSDTFYYKLIKEVENDNE